MSARLTGDRGLSLVEMLVAIVIAGMIGTATAGAFLIFMTTSRDSGAEQAIARDQFWLSSWWLADAQSTELWGAGTPPSDNAPIDGACPDVPADDADMSQPVAWLHWGDSEADPEAEPALPPTPEYDVNYRVERASTDEPWQLVRYFCERADPSKPTTQAVVAHSIVYPPTNPVIALDDGRLTIRLTSAIDETSMLEATGGPHVRP